MSESEIHLVMEQVKDRDGETVQEQYPLRAFETEAAAEAWRDQIEDKWREEHVVFDDRPERAVFSHTETEMLFRSSIQAVPMGPEADDA